LSSCVTISVWRTLLHGVSCQPWT